jgi:molybdate transport system ATP-binding protein
MSVPPVISARFDVDHAGFSMQLRLDLPGRGVTALFGHSGSGKTTILRAIAGLDRHPGAYLAVNGEVWQDDSAGLFLPTHRRALGYVFQEASLFPHLSVQGNLDFARKRAASSDAQHLAQAVELLGIGHLLGRRSTDLSGGERQRVAIARALLASPRLLLLDEPLASLDAKRKEEVLPYLERISTELDIPMLYVSHSAEEVARLADHLVLLDAGQVLASGPAAATLARIDRSMALDDDAGVIVEGRVDGFDAHYDLLSLQAAGATMHVAHTPMPHGATLRMRVLARDVSLTLDRVAGSSVLNQLAATVVEQWPASDAANVIVKLDAGGTVLLARITRRSRDLLSIENGKPVWAQVKAAALLAIH